MGWLNRLLGRTESRDSGFDDQFYNGTFISDFYGFGALSSSGVPITPNTALRASAVYACVRVLAESVSSLPLFLFERLPEGGKRRAVDHPLFSLLHDSPNEEMTTLEWRETLMGHLALRGNHYSQIIRTGGRPSALWPLNPDRVRPVRKNGKIWYLYTMGPDPLLMETGRSQVVAFNSSDILHIRGLSPNGLIGYSPIALAAETIGYSLAATAHGSRFWQNDATPGGVLEHPGKLSAFASKRLLQSWNEKRAGIMKAHGTSLLEEGMTYKQIGANLKESQFLESRQFAVTDIARIFRVPPHMISDLSKATFSNIEQQSLEFVTYTLTPWLVRIEQSINKWLLFESEKGRFFSEHVTAALLRGDIDSRFKAYATARQNGWMSADDVRELENQNPLPDGQGEIYMVPLNMIPADQLLKEPEPAPEPSSEPEPEPEENSRTIEARALRSPTNRARLARAHKPLFVDAAKRIVRAEIRNIRQGIKKHLQRDTDSFNTFLAEFYQEFPATIERNMTPVVRVYFEAVQAEAAEEVNADVGMTAEHEQFVREYVEAFTKRYAGSSQGQLESVVRESEPEEMAANVESRLTEWEEKRPEKVAKRETVQGGAALALLVFGLAGVERKIWINTGRTTCPFCQRLNGKTVSITSSFMGDGDVIDAGEAGRLTNHGSRLHPQLHDSCDCVVGPG